MMCSYNGPSHCCSEHVLFHVKTEICASVTSFSDLKSWFSIIIQSLVRLRLWRKRFRKFHRVLNAYLEGRSWKRENMICEHSLSLPMVCKSSCTISFLSRQGSSRFRHWWDPDACLPRLLQHPFPEAPGMPQPSLLKKTTCFENKIKTSLV